MKTVLRILALVAFAATTPIALTSCQTAPSERVVAVQTLLAVGQSAEAAVGISAQLYRDGRISAAKAREVLDFYSLKFQPAYRVAVSAARSDLNSLASPAVLDLAGQLAALVAQLYPEKP